MKTRLRDSFYSLLLFTCGVALLGCEHQSNKRNVIDSCDYLRSIPAVASEGLVNVVIEIPAGTNAKWETNKKTGFLEWAMNAKGERRTVNYLAYPANYGMVPQTWLPADEGGDNDPLDVFLLGPAVERGAVVQARIVGIVLIKDRDEQDDKLIAVPVNSNFDSVHTLIDLEEQFPGIVDILVLWLDHYKGNDAMQIESVANENAAQAILDAAIKAFPRFPSAEDLN